LLLAGLGLGFAVPLYAYVGYPLALKLLAIVRQATQRADEGGGVPAFRAKENWVADRYQRRPEDWPSITICVPAHNEEAVIGQTLENLLCADYPRDRVQILVMSDASSDRTDQIVDGFADRGVELLRIPRRVGKTQAENLAQAHLRGEIIVNTDASVRVAPDSLKPLLAAFASPEVGVASGQDESVGEADTANLGESGYVGYEMSVRQLETRVGGIVGASGCYYAIRRGLHATQLPPSLSRDFAAPLVAREAGYRSVSVPDAICAVPRLGTLGSEYRRKVRTIARGLRTLHFKRSVLNPLRYGLFAWMLFSHKLCRWLVPWAGVVALVAVAVLAVEEPWARWVLGGAVTVGALALLGLRATTAGPARALELLAFFLAGNIAVLHAWFRALSGEADPSWEPTRRPGSTSP
jgi:cellulose synthase/poly-beta-1,6-N-acetylglucosamine synthase-like glycosyltransferase